MSTDLSALFAEAAQYFPTPLQQFQFFDKTSRFDTEKGRRETWPETVDRAINYLVELAPSLEPWLRTEGRHMILTMQALPSMRLLAMAGSAARRQNLAIYNCSYLAVDDVQAFVEMLIISMSGCGVGFSVEQRNIDKLPIVKPQTNEHIGTHVVGDSTEGWAEALRLGLNTWWSGADVDFDVSQVRPAGAVLRTKGGRASGPEPLLRLLNTIKGIILSRQGQQLRSIDAHDIACAVGDAAVSGGMRRTAMISLYSQGDALMRAAKTGDYPSIRWNANNSEVWRRDPTDAEIEAQMAAMFAGMNGEPNIFSGAAAARTMPARRRELWERELGVSVEETSGTNPCFTGDALVLVADGRGCVPIQQLAEDGKDVPVFCLNAHGGVSVRTMRNPRVTGYQVPAVKIQFDDGSTMRVTPNHQIRLTDGTYRAARDLREGDAVGVLIREPYTIKEVFPKANSNSQAYWWLTYGTKSPRMEHRHIAEFAYGSIPKGHVVHHVDFNAQNNAPNNLRVMSREDHDHLHRAGMLGDSNPMRRAKTEWSDEKWGNYRAKQRAATGGARNGRALNVSHDDLREHALTLTRTLGHRFTHIEWQSYAKAHNLPQGFSAWRKNHLGGINGLAKWAALAAGFEHVDLDPRVRQTYETLTREGYDCQIVNRRCQILKRCELCGTEFATPASRREVGICSQSCVSRRNWSDPECARKMRENQIQYLATKKKQIQQDQINVYNDLRFSLKRNPLKAEWVRACKAKGVSHEIARKSSPYRTYEDLHRAAIDFNHRVVSVTEDGLADVYNGTVDDFHNFFTGGFAHPERAKAQVYFNSKQCGEITLRPRGLCNLSIAVPRPDDTLETLSRKVVAATIFGTIQATATHFPGLRPGWKRNAEQERLLGVDITGQMDCPLLIGPEAAHVFAQLKQLAIDVNAKIAAQLGINPAAAITTVKPAGNSAALLNCASGVHGRHARFYVRNVRVSAHSPIYRVLRDAGAPLSPENAQTAETATTWVCAFPVASPEGAVLKSALSAADQLAHWLLNKRHWAEHNVSCTVTYRPEEQAQIVEWVKAHRKELGGLSFLPAFDAAYEQMPYVEIDEAEYQRRAAAFPTIDWSRIALYEATDTTTSAQEVVCTGDRCEIR